MRASYACLVGLKPILGVLFVRFGPVFRGFGHGRFTAMLAAFGDPFGVLFGALASRLGGGIGRGGLDQGAGTEAKSESQS